MRRFPRVQIAASFALITAAVLAIAVPPKRSWADNPQTSSSTAAGLGMPHRALNKGFLHPAPVLYKYNEPGDLIELIPIVRDINAMIPRQFSLANHHFTLDSNRMTIKHSFYATPYSQRAVKNSVISFSYSGGFGRQFNTRLDVPLFYSSVFGFSDWSRYPLGNYTMTISSDGFERSKDFYIRALTRF